MLPHFDYERERSSGIVHYIACGVGWQLQRLIAHLVASPKIPSTMLWVVGARVPLRFRLAPAIIMGHITKVRRQSFPSEGIVNCWNTISSMDTEYILGTSGTTVISCGRT